MCFKFRKLRPCVITHIKYDVSVPEDDELQILVVANIMAAMRELPILPELAVCIIRVVVCFWFDVVQKRRVSSLASGNNSSPVPRATSLAPMTLLPTLSITSLLGDRERPITATAVITPMDSVPGSAQY